MNHPSRPSNGDWPSALVEDYAALYKVAPELVRAWLLELGAMHLSCWMAYGVGWAPEFFDDEERARALRFAEVIRSRSLFEADPPEVRRKAWQVVKGGRSTKRAA